MKNLIKEIFDNSEYLITEYFNDKVDTITNKGLDKIIKYTPDTKELFSSLSPNQRETLDGSIEDNLLEIITESMLYGFKSGFNTAQELHGSQCLI